MPSHFLILPNVFVSPISAASAMQAEVADYVCAVTGNRGINGFKDKRIMRPEAGCKGLLHHKSTSTWRISDKTSPLQSV